MTDLMWTFVNNLGVFLARDGDVILAVPAQKGGHMADTEPAEVVLDSIDEDARLEILDLIRTGEI